MDRIKAAYETAKSKYDLGGSPIEDIVRTSLVCLSKLEGVEIEAYGAIGYKSYAVYKANQKISRPFLPGLMLGLREYEESCRRLFQSADPVNHRFRESEELAARVTYTTLMSFSICYDLWKPGSRKTPGTYFEIVLGAFLSVLCPEATRNKFIPLQAPVPAVHVPLNQTADASVLESALAVDIVNGDVDPEGSVSTDIVFEFSIGALQKGIVIPAKITTRERIVQPFAHQRILDSAFGVGRYISLLACISETQRDDKNHRVNDICVPGTIRLFQQYLARLDGIYYLDPPDRYLAMSAEGIIPVSTIGSLLTSGFDRVVRQLRTSPAG